MWIALAIIALLALFGGFIPGARRLMTAFAAAIPMSLYRDARKRGASPQHAIFEAVQMLRYRSPWSELSDQELSDAAEILATLHDPAQFCGVVAEVERTRNLAPFRNLEALRSFVDFANSRVR